MKKGLFHQIDACTLSAGHPLGLRRHRNKAHPAWNVVYAIAIVISALAIMGAY